MPEAVIVATGRSAVGRAYKGSLADVRPDDLLGFVFRQVVDRSGVDPKQIDDIVIGQTQTYGAGGALDITRGSTFLAGFPETVPSTTVNRFCGSSLQAMRIALHAIRSGEADTVLVGGVESVSQCMTAEASASVVVNPRFAHGEDDLPAIYTTMGETAERVADAYDVSRADMDRFALQSHQRAARSQQDGFFAREIIPFTKADGSVVAVDDGPRPSTTLEVLGGLKPVFRADGRVTAGNSCPLNDGAAAVVVMNEERARAEGHVPLARIRATGLSGVAPELMGIGPIEAVRRAVERAGLSIADVEVLELNEAFAAQVLAVVRELGIDEQSDRLNPHGGAIALGHPFGMTGARIMTSLLNDLQTLDRTIGVETMCVGGGMGIAMVVERLS